MDVSRHEEVAAFAAGAEAQLSGRTGGLCRIVQPGNLHLINGLFDCHRNHVPVLAIPAPYSLQRLAAAISRKPRPRALQECRRSCELVPARADSTSCWRLPCAKRCLTVAFRLSCFQATWR
ncbi:thiamine pyrophosphate-binding protein [Escherichia coli]